MEIKRKILIINRGPNTDNYGDQAINFCLSELLKRQGCLVDSEDYTKVFVRSKRGLIRLIHNIAEMRSVVRRVYDCVIIGGGQLVLGNQKFPWALLSWALIIRLFSNAPIVLFAVGVDSNFSFIKKLIVKAALSMANSVFVRDKKSRDNLMNIFDTKCEVVPDIVMAISKLYQKKDLKKSDSILLFGITQYSSISKYNYIMQTRYQYYESQAKTLLRLASNFKKVGLIYNTRGDYHETLKFKEFLQDNHHVAVEICQYNDLSGFIDRLANADLVVSGRMHSIIIASSFGVRAIPFARNSKLKAFADEYFPLEEPDSYFGKITNALQYILRTYATPR